MEKLLQTNAELLRQKERNRDLLSTIQRRSVLQTPCAVNTNTGFVPSIPRTLRKRMAFPTPEEMKKVSHIIFSSLGFQTSDIILVSNLVKF